MSLGRQMDLWFLILVALSVAALLRATADLLSSPAGRRKSLPIREEFVLEDREELREGEVVVVTEECKDVEASDSVIRTSSVSETLPPEF
ncbi:hypothetical protein NL676_026214 [Syzygium grande]|nr:hypothetical protein NL676_026214 [Syzygium grande]